MEDFIRSPGGVLAPKIFVQGIWRGLHIRNGELIDKWEDPNIVVNEGLNSLLSVVFNGGVQITTWYLAPFEGNYTPVATNTAANITSTSTECTAYTQSLRVAYTPAAAASQQVTNSASVATFTFNATKSVYGAFLISNSVKSATSGTLFSAARFSAVKNVVSGDQLLLTYTFTASSV